MAQASPIKVSAIMSLYKAEKFVASALENLLRQTMLDQMEIIVINADSPQNEEEIVKIFQRQYPERIVYHRTPHETLYASWNYAALYARGKYLINANADDRLRHDAYEVMSGTLDRHDGIGLVYADVYATSCLEDITEFQELEPPKYWGRFYRQEYSYDSLRQGCYIGAQPMWRKSLHEEFGLFDPQYVVAGDWEFWLRAGAGSEFMHIPECLGLYYNNPDGLENCNGPAHGKERHIINKLYQQP